MKLTILLSTLAAVSMTIAFPAYSYACDVYYDSTEATDVYGNEWCWLSGAICYSCYDDQTGDSCTSNWSECDPYPFHEDQQTALWIDEGPRGETAIRVCRSMATAPPNLDVSRLL